MTNELFGAVSVVVWRYKRQHKGSHKVVFWAVPTIFADFCSVFIPEVARDVFKSKVLKLVTRSGPQLKSQPIAQLCRFFVNKTIFVFEFVYEKSLITEQICSVVSFFCKQNDFRF